MNYKQQLEAAKRKGTRFTNAAGEGNGNVRQLSPNESVLILKMKLIDGGTTGGKVKLFGALDKDENATYNTANNVSITGAPETYTRMVERLRMGQFFRVSGARLDVVNSTQAANVIKVVTSPGAGSEHSATYTPSASRTSKDMNANLLDLIDFQALVDESTRFEYEIDKSVAAAEVILTLFVSEKMDSSKALNGQAVIAVNNNANSGVVKERMYSGRF